MILHRHLLSLIALGLLCPLVAPAQDEEAENEPKEDLETILSRIKNSDYKRELKALEEAATIMEGVTDEASAKKAAQKLRSMFNNLPGPTKGSAAELDAWAKAQNRVSFHMWRLCKEPYFESSKLQEAWTLITVPSMRLSAER